VAGMTRSPYPGSDVLAEAGHWDERTREVVRRRIEHVPPYRFFDRDDAALLEAICDRIIPQHDRRLPDRVPIAPFIDETLHRGETDGFRHPDMPWDQEAWRLGLRAVDEEARLRHGRSFGDLPGADQDALLTRVQHGQVDADAWSAIKPGGFFKKLVEQAVTVYYAHPTAWDEIGWGGPASPRGYARTGYGRRDPWEARERGDASSVAILRGRAQRQAAPGGTGGATH
jgi:hypothetical protein